LYEITLEPLNGFAPNSQGRRVWSLTQASLKVKVKVKVTRDNKWHFSVACVQFMFDKTYLASSFIQFGSHLAILPG